MCVSINGPGDPDLRTFGLETGVRVTSKVGNRPSKFGHARPLRSRIIRYVRDGWRNRQTDERTDKSNAYYPRPYGRRDNSHLTNKVLRSVGLRCSMPNLKL